MSQRYFEFDLVRAIAIIAVLMIHVAAFYPWFSNSFSWYGYYTYYQITSFAVPVFVIMAGCLAAIGAESKKVKYIVMLLQKAKFILIPYLLWSLVYVVLNHSGKGFSEISKLLLYGKSSFHLYFVIIILQLFVLLPLFLFFAKKFPMESVFISLMAQWGIAEILETLLPSIASAFGASLFANWIFVFYAGCWAGINYEKVICFIDGYFSAIVGVLAAFSIYKVGDYYYVVNIAEKAKFYSYGQTATLQNAFYSILVVMFLLYVGRIIKNRACISTVGFIARYSFGVYLSHMVFLSIVKEYYSENGIRSSGLTVFFALMIIMLASYLFSVAIARLPAGRFFMGGR